jgi:Flp pilus assembly protein TadG
MRRLRWTHRDHGDSEAGAATVFVVTFAVVLLVMAGLVVDGGLAINARQRVADDVEQAARAGSQHLDLEALRTSGVVRIDPGPETQKAVRDFLARRGYPAGGIRVTANAAQITVSAEIEQRTALLSLIFINQFTIRAQGQARPAVGIAGEDIP